MREHEKQKMSMSGKALISKNKKKNLTKHKKKSRFREAADYKKRYFACETRWKSNKCE